MKKRTDRIGEEATNRQGLKMRIVEYVNSKSIGVLFVETGEIKHTRYTRFINGEVKADLDNYPVITENDAVWKRAGCAVTMAAMLLCAAIIGLTIKTLI